MQPSTEITAFLLQRHLVEPLRSLLWAEWYARDADVDGWQFAVERECLLAMGLTLSDIRWLLHQRLIEHALEVTGPGASTRCFQQLGPAEVPARSCFRLSLAAQKMLTEALAPGNQPALVPCLESRKPVPTHIAAATLHSPRWVESEGRTEPAPWQPKNGEVADREVAGSEPSAAGSEFSLQPTIPRDVPKSDREVPPTKKSVLPSWDSRTRILRMGEAVIKRFRVPAHNQELVLTVFEEEGWPNVIDDPLPQLAAVDPIRRLQATIRSLNRNRIAPSLRFFGNGSGGVVCWEDTRSTR